MVLWLQVILIAAVFQLSEGGEEREDQTQGPTEAINRIPKTASYNHLIPFVLPERFLVDDAQFGRAGFTKKDPGGYALLFQPITTDVIIYIFPPHTCEGVWLCFAKGFNITSSAERPITGVFNFSFADICKTSLRFQPYEQTVYVFNGGSMNDYPFVSSMAEILLVRTQTGEEFHFEPLADFDGGNISNVQQNRKREILDIMGAYVVVLTTSAYCRVRIMEPLNGGVSAAVPLHLAKDSDDVFHVDNSQIAAPFYQTGTHKGSHIRAGRDHVIANAFDNPAKRSSLKKAELDCCVSPWLFEGFIEAGDWADAEHYPTYNQFKLGKVDKSECNSPGGASTVQFFSFLLEVGERCEWARLCFDQGNDFCKNDVHTLSFIFSHGVYIPTDSDEARLFGIEFEDIHAIRINFISGEKGIEIAYAFSDHVTPGISDLMQLDVWDGQDVSKLTLNLVKAPYCQARLLNDLGGANLRVGNEMSLQCLFIKSCTCLE
ncbi:hypothetical protein Q1695_009920 [Nippostrongylus brasiliensis]|nr:hypothetical protein Q1695_009920 [Nippostrongylus brasiliensis]